MFCAGIFAVVGDAYNTEEGGEWCCMLKFGTMFLSLKSGFLRRRFTNSLALMVWVSVAWIAYEMWFKVLADLITCTVMSQPILVASSLLHCLVDSPGLLQQSCSGAQHDRLLCFLSVMCVHRSSSSKQFLSGSQSRLWVFNAGLSYKLSPVHGLSALDGNPDRRTHGKLASKASMDQEKRRSRFSSIRCAA